MLNFRPCSFRRIVDTGHFLCTDCISCQVFPWFPNPHRRDRNRELCNEDSLLGTSRNPNFIFISCSN